MINEFELETIEQAKQLHLAIKTEAGLDNGVSIDFWLYPEVPEACNDLLVNNNSRLFGLHFNKDGSMWKSFNKETWHDFEQLPAFASLEASIYIFDKG